MNHSPYLAVRLFLFYNSLFILTHQYLRKTLRLTFEEGVQMLKVWDFSVFVINIFPFTFKELLYIGIFRLLPPQWRDILLLNNYLS